MSSELKVLQILVLFFTLFSSTYYSNGEFILEGSVAFNSSGFIILTNTTKHFYGQAFSYESFQYKNSSFNISFFFAIVPDHNQQGSHGMAFVISPTRNLPGASSDLRNFNATINGKSSNNIIAMELDIHKDEDFEDINDNHVGININGMRSLVSARAGYYDEKDGNFKNLSLISGKVMRLSLVYSQPRKQLNVTLSPAEFSVPPLKPLLSLNLDLSRYVLEKMYFCFTVLPEVIPIIPPYSKKVYVRRRTILAVFLTLALIAAFIASWIEVLEKWKIQYGPHRFAYKELFNATVEKQLLGRGGFGQVYKRMFSGYDAEFMLISNSVSQLPGNLFDVVKAERLRGRPEISMEVVLDVNSISTLSLTHSLMSHGR